MYRHSISEVYNLVASESFRRHGQERCEDLHSSRPTSLTVATNTFPGVSAPDIRKLQNADDVVSRSVKPYWNI